MLQGFSLEHFLLSSKEIDETSYGYLILMLFPSLPDLETVARELPVHKQYHAKWV